MHMESPKIALLGKTLYEIQQITANIGMPKFAAKQITSWLYEKKVNSIDEMTNLSLKHREALKEGYEVGASAPVEAMRSVDGTVKYLFRTPTNDYVEAVYIPDNDIAYGYAYKIIHMPDGVSAFRIMLVKAQQGMMFGTISNTGNFVIRQIYIYAAA